MKDKNQIIEIARETLKIERDSIDKLIDFVNEEFAKAVELIYRSSGRVVVTGIGKSAIIAQKIVATFNSTGTPSIFLHAADAIHGDLGMVLKDDVVICISKSGDTPEVKVLVPLIKGLGNSIIGLTGNMQSYLAEHSDLRLNCFVEKEACPNNLAPTNSTTAQLVMGDALAVCLIECRNFGSQDFAKYHPGGALGKKLYLKISDIYPNNERPTVGPEMSLKEAIIEISAKRLGVTAVEDKGQLVGVITDGDLRRMLSKNMDISEVKAKDIMTASPKTISPEIMAVEAVDLMKKNNISQLIVAEGKNYLGIVHFHDLLKEGLL